MSRAQARSAVFERRRSFFSAFVPLLALGALFAGAVLIFAPFTAPLVMALVVAITAYPLFERILGKLGAERRGFASGLTCAVLILAVFLPLGWMGWAIVREIPNKAEVIERASQLKKDFEGTDFYAKNGWAREAWTAAWSWRSEPDSLKDEAAKASHDLAWSKVADVFLWLKSSLFPIVSGTIQVFLKFCLMLFMLFFFLKDGPPLLRSLERQIPLERQQLDRITATFAQVSRSIIRGTLGTAFVQGLCAGVAYAVVGVPAVLWGFVTMVCALIPPLGTTLVTVPVTGYLLLKEQYWQAVVLGLVSVGVGFLDNILKPLLMKEGLRVHSLWLFLVILGGINAFGPMGLIYGPMVLVFLGTFIALFVQGHELKPRLAPESARGAEEA